MTLHTENDRIPVAAAGVLLVASIAEFNFVFGPRLTIAVAGNFAWIAIIPAAGLVALAVWVATSLGRLYPGRTLAEIAPRVLGRSLGNLVVAVYIAYWLVRIGQLIQLQTYVFGVTLLEQTPRVAIALYIVLLSAYLAAGGIEPLSRVALLLAPAHVPLIAITAAAFYTGDFGRLLPLEFPGVKAALSGVWSVFSNAPGVEVLLVVGPFLAGKGSTLKAALVAVILLAVAAVTLTLALIANFGVSDTHQFLMPTLELSRIARAPGFEGFQLDPIFVVMWFAVTFTAIATIHYMAVLSLGRLFGARGRHWPLFATSAASALLGAYPLGAPQLFGAIEATRQVVVPVMSLGIPLLLLGTALARRAISGTRG